MTDPSPSTQRPAPQSIRQDDDAVEQDLLARARAHIVQEFDGQPPVVELSIEDKRIRLSGRVRDADTAERIAKAAAIGPGVLGVRNELQIDSASPPSAPRVEAPSAVNPAADAPEAGDRGVPLPPPQGPIHHKV